MLRIRFTSADLARVRVASGPHPLWESVLSINGLQYHNLPARYWAWRSALSEHQDILRAAYSVVPASGNFADFLTPTSPATDVDEQFDAIRRVPQAVVRDDLARTYPAEVPTPRWAEQVYDSGRVDPVVQTLERYHHTAVRPVWSAVQTGVEQARQRLTALLLSAGVEGLLSRLHTSIRWRDPILEADYLTDQALDLDGRGLLIVPSYFCFGAPVTFIDGDLPPTLVLPIQPDDAPVDESIGDLDVLVRLLGPTRAKFLAGLESAASTSELAHRLGVSPGSISQHAKVLRESGLITTTRFGHSVNHTLTPLGRAVLRGL
ncbi:ArsR/SmtB family transcription factor [Kribbella jiaozuonensis]|uniref:Winged helix-turn-helix transcriptional regulator n=1 Tax=Kribbella jiaozuonensis TaxID=2575441 RepID=A0A4U3LMK0_9ACTN|nr:winged helix-turn-helix domain-containing protein [Kribbella jiaozuonensis]TKK76369.1 winged helix-turn-helix transcriptional regulator [Kribbella jiaozuonensis]